VLRSTAYLCALAMCAGAALTASVAQAQPGGDRPTTTDTAPGQPPAVGPANTGLGVLNPAGPPRTVRWGPARAPTPTRGRS
jgi:hypothetical protein